MIKKLLICAALCMAFMVPGSMAADKATVWTIFMYICGSDLERFAVEDIKEMLAADLPDNVQIYIQAGGAGHWPGLNIADKKINRYLIKNGKLKLLQKLPNSSMGDQATLESFIDYGLKNYRGDKNMLVFWNHGGGAAAGVAFDVNYTKGDNIDSLSLVEIENAFRNLAQKGDNPFFEIIGFDACLMATLDTAMAVNEFGRYMIASQELEPGTGWMYTGWLNYLGENTEGDTLDVARAIVDSFFDSVEGNTETLSVTDLKKARTLFYNYNMLGLEAMNKGARDKALWSSYNKTANQADGFGNDKSQKSFTGMVDLGDWVERMAKKLPEYSSKVLKNLDEAVVYQKVGPYHNAHGLSVFYHFHDKDLTRDLFNSAWLDLFKFNAYYAMKTIPKKELDKEFERYWNWFHSNTAFFLNSSIEDFDLGEEEEKPKPEQAVQVPVAPAKPDETASSGIDKIEESFLNVPVDFTKDGDFIIKLTQKQVDLVESVSFNLYVLDEKENIFLELGSDADLDTNWDKGTVSSRFNGYWPCLDGHILRMELVHIADKYYRYNVPIKVNGKRMDMTVIYDFSDEKYHIGAIRKPTEHGMLDREGYKLKAGDKITTIMLASALDSDDDSEEIDLDTFAYKNDSKIVDEDLGDAVFRLQFMFVGVDGSIFGSAIVESEAKGGEMTQSILDMKELTSDDDEDASNKEAKEESDADTNNAAKPKEDGGFNAFR